MPAADHREAVAARKIGRRVELADGLLAGVDQVGIDLVGIRKRPDPEHAILGLQGDRHSLGDIIGHQRRNANAEIDVIAILQLARRARRHLIAVPGH